MTVEGPTKTLVVGACVALANEPTKPLGKATAIGTDGYGRDVVHLQAWRDHDPHEPSGRNQMRLAREVIEHQRPCWFDPENQF